ncbi:MAG: hypothetical protein ACRD6Q_03070 [Nitrososphaeraceae archaeon]
MINNILTISAGLLAISYFLIFGASYYGYANATSSTVSAGGDGDSWDKYTPQNVTINAGENVTWTNPMKVVEPHTVTFVKDKEMIPPLVAPFSVPNNTQFTPAVPAPNVEPTTMPDNTNPNNKLVIVDNQRASAPVIIDDSKTNITYLQPNSNYSFVGNESYVNSGWMFPMGLVPPGAPPITSFTRTFENPGTNYYICVLHPWMSGTVTVK